MYSSQTQEITVEDVGDITVIRFTEPKILNEQQIQFIGFQLFSIVDELGRKNILINLEGVEWVSTPFIGKILTLLNKIKVAKGKLVLCSITSQLDEIFEITRLNRKFKIVKDDQEGLKEFAIKT